jgi:D,D-heptose 1,7-bisphosphate phosphatase
MRKRAVFLDRDGTLVLERGIVVSATQLILMEGVCDGLIKLHEAGFELIMVTNQAVVARGLIDVNGLDEIHESFQQMLVAAGARRLDAIYACVHHPQANLLEYRVDCACRKPRAGLLELAAKERGLELSKCYLIGDRLTDIAAARRVRCRSVLVQCEGNLPTPIVTNDDYLPYAEPNVVCPNFTDAANWILNDLQEGRNGQ